MQSEPSPNFRQIMALLPKLSGVDLQYLAVMLPGYLAKAGIADTEDLQLVPTGEELAGKVLKLLKSPENLSGPESALLAGVLTQYGAQFGLGSDEAFESRVVTQELRRENRTLSNITSVMDSLVERGLVEHLDEGKKGTHREYRVTPKGCTEAAKICRRAEERPNEGKTGAA
jgi:DNA-binding MarR family transcriptional regulator